VSNHSGVVENGNFQYLHLLFLQMLWSANIIILYYLFYHRLSIDPKIHDFNNIEWPFYVKFCFFFQVLSLLIYLYGQRH